MEIINPLDGEIIDDNDVDALLSFIETMKYCIERLREAVSAAESSIVQKAQFGEGLTSRIRGKIKRCRLTKSSYNWDQKSLSSLYQHPCNKEIIKVGSYKVSAKEYEKIKNELSNDESFKEFKDKLLFSNLGRIGKVTIQIENNIGE